MKRLCSLARLALVALLFGGTFAAADAKAAGWAVRAEDGMPVLARGGAAALTTNFAFWGKNWAWAHQSAQFKVLAPFDYAIAGNNQILNLDLAARIRKSADRSLAWDLDFNARSASTDVVGGGMVFQFDLAAFGAEFGEPQLLPENRGWTWGRPGGNRLEMRFEPPLAAVFFEAGKKNEVRAFFYKGEVPLGHRRHVATLSLAGDIVIDQTTQERFGAADHTKWPADILAWNVSPVDLSFLNAAEKPAGKRGFVKVVKDKLQFEDGTEARFWGTNITAYALFQTPKDAVRAQAKRLSELGFNLVRLHHHDSPWVVPNVFGDERAANTKVLQSDMLDRLDWWIKCLKDEGIYVWLDMHVMRALRPGDDIDSYQELAKGKPSVDLKGYNYVNASIREAMKRFNEDYVTHISAYTGLRHADEPAIAAMLITNENDLTHHYGHSLLANKGVLMHNALYMIQVEAFAKAHGLNKDRTARSWEPGPSKLFLNDLERRFNIEMIASLRAAGVKVPIVTTSTWGASPISSLPALTSGSMIDVHAYGRVGELEANPVHAPNMVHWLAASQVVGKPLSVTEWNVEPFPTADRHTVPLYVAAAASHQGWSALMQYAFSQAPLISAGNPSNWHAYNDPALMATLPAAALAYRRGDVRAATTTYVLAPSREQLYDQAISPANSVAIRTAVEKGRLLVAMPQTKELPWLEKSAIPAGATVISNPAESLLKGDAVEALSDTGELRRNWERGTYLINTPRTQSAMGWIGGQKIDLGDVEIRASTRNATIAVQSLDGRPIAKAGAILISLGARSQPKTENQLPFHSEPVEGKISIRAVSGLKLYNRAGPADKGRVIPAPYSDGRYRITLDRSIGSYWLVLK
ncbi:MAG: glycosyl hydrolase family 5 [Betaproteobacteria bacterium]